MVQNLVYNTTTGGAVKDYDTPSGLLVYQNTFIGAVNGPASNVHYRNNPISSDGWFDPALATGTFAFSTDRTSTGAERRAGGVEEPARPFIHRPKERV